MYEYGSTNMSILLYIVVFLLIITADFLLSAFQLNNRDLAKQQKFIVAYCVFQSNLSQGKLQDSMENDSVATASKYFDGF